VDDALSVLCEALGGGASGAWRRGVGARRDQLRRQTAAREHGEAVQVDPVKPKAKAPGSKRLKLKCDKLLSSFAFNFNLRCFSTDVDDILHAHIGGMDAMARGLKAGRGGLTLSNPI